ncbi:uncharacterized protein Z518_11189 [Rhinocladiella mackenziei CBS 650.93]|uniref:Uncharacterized protein n=1 Tax=Rhinocladiella mackenziei CBS 650.93 TaxID=1442369 RepID=A0A0D2I885_9EURO|nr:uncharacterized protein Z518_11189 [Rhinocladiella mackenziei CBS 650.93]KIW99450.1 hypothetical protein Z518_11189 [Rhinocladiella mackenziei CBS 650.93]
MAHRPALRRERDNVDYSAVGKLGRRTGVTLDHRPLDVNGMEEISGIFSSPRKPSPLKTMIEMENVEELSASPKSVEMSGIDSPGITPSQALSSRRSARGASLPPRSSSPRKSGISGTARKSNGMDIFSVRKGPQYEDLEDRENTPILTPSRTIRPKRCSLNPEKSPLRDITTNMAYANGKSRPSLLEIEQATSDIGASIGDDDILDSYKEIMGEVEAIAQERSDFVPAVDDDNEAMSNHEIQSTSEGLRAPPPEFDDEQTFEPEPSEPPVPRNQANSRKKRKSDVVENDWKVVPPPIPSKISKTNERQFNVQSTNQPECSNSSTHSSKLKGKQPLRDKDTNMKLSSRQEKELNNIIEKVKARPGPPRSLYILRRETPANDGMMLTRSGRISVKPLAYWRNERCVYGGSPSDTSLQDGARFPLNSIKEIIRTEEIDASIRTKKPKGKKKIGQEKSTTRGSLVDDSGSPNSDSSDSDLEMSDAPRVDPYAEPWEIESGTLRGNVSIWDQQEQVPMEQEEEVEIAHAPGAIKIRNVKGSSLEDGPSFRYAKLLSTKFFGTGLVDLPPGGVKRPKNSRKMHMSFFVVKGRVTVTVGPPGGEETGSMTRFSIGKGGFWQVPRGK